MGILSSFARWILKDCRERISANLVKKIFRSPRKYDMNGGPGDISFIARNIVVSSYDGSSYARASLVDDGFCLICCQDQVMQTKRERTGLFDDNDKKTSIVDGSQTWKTVKKAKTMSSNADNTFFCIYDSGGGDVFATGGSSYYSIVNYDAGLYCRSLVNQRRRARNVCKAGKMPTISEKTEDNLSLQTKDQRAKEKIIEQEESKEQKQQLRGKECCKLELKDANGLSVATILSECNTYITKTIPQTDRYSYTYQVI